MRAILMFANLVLACVIAYCAYGWYNEPSVGAEVATSVSKERKAASPQPKAVGQQPQRQYATVTPENQIATTVALNIFDPERAPKATVNRNNRTNTPVNRNDMSLAGTFVIGDITGAIIIQRSQQMQMMRQQQTGRNNQNGTQATAEELAAAQELAMQQALDNRAELNNLLQTLQNTEGVTEEQSALLRQRLDRANQQVELLQNQNQQRATGRDGRTADGTAAPVNASNSYKQYIRVGETLSNGYTLAAVTRTSATLTRGNNDTIELAMQDASTSAGRNNIGGMGAMGGMGGMGGNRAGGGMAAVIVGGGNDFGGGGFGGGAGGRGGAGGFGGGGMGGGMGGGGFGGGGMGGGMGGGGFGGGGMGGGFGGGNAGGATASFGGGNARGGNTGGFGGGNTRGGGATTTTRAGGGNTTTRAGGATGGNARGGMGGGRGGR